MVRDARSSRLKMMQSDAMMTTIFTIRNCRPPVPKRPSARLLPSALSALLAAFWKQQHPGLWPPRPTTPHGPSCLTLEALRFLGCAKRRYLVLAISNPDVKPLTAGDAHRRMHGQHSPRDRLPPCSLQAPKAHSNYAQPRRQPNPHPPNHRLMRRKH